MENLLTNTENKGTSIKITVEKLDGGFISNAEGKRKIYKEADCVLDALNMKTTIGNLDDAEYHLNIDIIHKDDYQDWMNLVMLHKDNAAFDSIQSAKDAGVIEEAEKFNPLPKMEEPDLTAPIKVTAANAYTVGRLKAINWADMHEQVPMQPSEITAITGMNTTTLYASLPKARKGDFSFQNVSTRIGFTILAQYYEKTLGIRTSTKDNCEKMKEDVLKMIRDIEKLSTGKAYIKSSEVLTKLVAMRTSLL